VLTVYALNNTKPVESIFSHMRALEENSHRTRAPLMEDVIGAKLEPVSFVSPPDFLPAHIITPENLWGEGRDAQTGMGSRMATGATALKYHISEGARKVEKTDKREKAAAQQRQDASETVGVIVWECAEGGGKVVRVAPGERSTFSHLETMGQYRAECFKRSRGTTGS